MTARDDSWKREPFGPVAPIPYAAVFTPAELERIGKGLIPQAMEDKWFIYFEEPSLFLHRSWTGQAVYRVDFERDGDEIRVAEAFCATDLLAGDEPAYQALLLSFLISNLLLGRAEPFPMPDGLTEPAPGVYQHVVAGTGYPESPAPRRRPWWKFWRR
jgi:hypothetical protein